MGILSVQVSHGRDTLPHHDLYGTMQGHFLSPLEIIIQVKNIQKTCLETPRYCCMSGSPTYVLGARNGRQKLVKNLPGMLPLCKVKKGSLLPCFRQLVCEPRKKPRLVNVGERRKPMLKTPCRGAASTYPSWESRYPWGTVSLSSAMLPKTFPSRH